MGVEVQNPNPLSAFQNAAAAPKLIRASKTFTGAENLGATGVNELFTTTGAVLIEEVLVRCATTLADTVDGAEFTLGTTNDAALFSDGTTATGSALDLDTITTGKWLISPTGAPSLGVDDYGYRLNWVDLDGTMTTAPVAIDENLIMTVSVQNITSGVLEFYILYRPLSSDGALAIGAGMTAI